MRYDSDELRKVMRLTYDHRVFDMGFPKYVYCSETAPRKISRGKCGCMGRSHDVVGCAKLIWSLLFPSYSPRYVYVTICSVFKLTFKLHSRDVRKLCSSHTSPHHLHVLQEE